MRAATKLKIKKYAGFVFNMISIILMIVFLEGQWLAYGLLGFLLMWAIIIVIRLTRSPFFIAGLRNLETSIWQKPLDKDMWRKGELKKLKVKMVWRDKPKNEKSKS